MITRTGRAQALLYFLIPTFPACAFPSAPIYGAAAYQILQKVNHREEAGGIRRNIESINKSIEDPPSGRRRRLVASY